MKWKLSIKIIYYSIKKLIFTNYKLQFTNYNLRDGRENYKYLH
jgi:hypothetical protein